METPTLQVYKDEYDAIQAFVNTGSFSSAGKSIGVSGNTVRKRILYATHRNRQKVNTLDDLRNKKFAFSVMAQNHLDGRTEGRIDVVSHLLIQGFNNKQIQEKTGLSSSAVLKYVKIAQERGIPKQANLHLPVDLLSRLKEAAEIKNLDINESLREAIEKWTNEVLNHTHPSDKP